MMSNRLDDMVLGQQLNEAISFLRRRKKPLMRVLQIGTILLIFGLILRALYSNWNAITDYAWEIRYGVLAVSFMISIFSASFSAYLLKLIAARLGANIPFRQTFRLFYLSQLTRYIPGMLWGILGWAYLAEREAGVRKTSSAAALILHLLFQVVSGVVIFVLTIPFWEDVSDTVGLIPILLLLPFGLLLLQPRLVKSVFNLGLRLAGQQPLDIEWGYRFLLTQLSLSMVAWVGRGLASYFLINSITYCAPSKFGVIVGVFAIAWVVGLVSVLTPSGLGIMEASITLLLSFTFPVYVAAIIALLTRLMRTFSDLACAAIAWRL
jgi:uncharacterized membrane protein YbhN (UPF0104 family)